MVKKIQQFLTNHSLSQAIYRKYSSLQLLKYAETRFASQFIMIECLFKVKQSLREMAISVEWERWKISSSVNSSLCEEIVDLIVGSREKLFWKQVEAALKIFYPIYEVLRLCDSNSPSMGEIFEKMDQTRESLFQILQNDSFSFDQHTKDLIWECSEKRWRMLHSPLHSIGFLLNPKWFHKKPWIDEEVNKGWKTYIDRCFSSREDRVKIKKEYGIYIKSEGDFAHPDCAYDREALDAFTFWNQYGTQTPLLKEVAIRVLSQVSSASACERNWSEYAFIHSTKRNRLGTAKAEDLVFVHSNIRLLSQSSQDYKMGPHRMWDYGGSMDDGDDEFPMEVLDSNYENMFDDKNKKRIKNNSNNMV